MIFFIIQVEWWASIIYSHFHCENVRAATEIKYHVVLSSNVICMRMDLPFECYYSHREMAKGFKSTCLFGRSICIKVKLYLLASHTQTHTNSYIYWFVERTVDVDAKWIYSHPSNTVQHVNKIYIYFCWIVKWMTVISKNFLAILQSLTSK